MGVGVGVAVGVPGVSVGVGVIVGVGVAVRVAVGGLKPAGATTSSAPTTKIGSCVMLSAVAAYVNNGADALSLSTVAYPLLVSRLSNPSVR